MARFASINKFIREALSFRGPAEGKGGRNPVRRPVDHIQVHFFN